MSDDNAGKLTRLEEEGELAADYLEELLDIADLDGDIEIDVENGRASVEIVADDPEALDRLVGEDGEVLDALQELTRLAVQTETGERSRLMLDIAGFRAERKEELQDITREAIARVRATGEAVLEGDHRAGHAHAGDQAAHERGDEEGDDDVHACDAEDQHDEHGEHDCVEEQHVCSVC